MLQIRKSQERGITHAGWLLSNHTFSFGRYYDPEQLGFSDLLVINDDRVQPGEGFGSHAHHDMEIFSYVMDGALEHKDSMGTGSVIRPGDVQMMSAGTGIRHSEFNTSTVDIVHFLQIWIVPNRQGVTPRYQQVHFSPSDKRGALRCIISPEGKDGSLSVYQDTTVYAGLFDGPESTSVELSPNRFAYIHIARGKVNVNGISMEEGDGARIRSEKSLTIHNGEDAEVLLFDLRPIEVPKI